MKDSDRKPQAVRLRDYRPPAFLIDRADLEFDLDPARTLVRSKLVIRRNPAAGAPDAPLALDGEQLELQELTLNGEPVESGCSVDAHRLVLESVPDAFELEVTNSICPEANTALEGLYLSSGNFCSQCEAEGFRRITYYLDRPDVMARFSTTIRADAERYPALLSNGNRVGQGELAGGRHWVRWEDPYPKPSYLFALVAGKLAALSDRYTTASGREVGLEIYVQPHNRDKCDYAMQSLKNAMAWDERTFGLEYDLDTYMIVAVDDFNMGAMENKGLNIFNSKYVLARPETATDSDFQHIEGVIGHEYFHNWTGNRVTCRDWFQLSLKEGLTVFRDQEFSSDMSARAIKRIQDVQMLRTVQFAEDAGPMAHPVRPESYIEINNFYTVTVYEKGAEVIRMQHTLLGPGGFRKGLRLYLERNDGRAVTIEDFVSAMEEANGVDLTQFRRWYSQAGTPRLDVSAIYEPDERRYHLTFHQQCPPTPGQPAKRALHIPVAVGLLDARGGSLTPVTDDGRRAAETLVLDITESRQTVTFVDVPEKPVPSLLRGFSAPVKLRYPYPEDELRLLMAHDPDSFNRWEAGQRYAEQVLGQLIETGGESAPASAGYLRAFTGLLEDQDQEPALVAETLRLPGEKYLGEQYTPMDPQAIHRAREAFALRICREVGNLLRERYAELSDPDAAYSPDAGSIGRRALKNLCLGYLMRGGGADAVELSVAQYRNARNMTDRLAALALLVDRGGALADDVLEDFYETWRADPLVLDKWFAIQAASRRDDAFVRVRRLRGHKAFSIGNPNKVRALVGVFCMNNPARFHAPSGEGYTFLGDQVLELDKLNPQVAARLATALNPWRRLVEPQSGLMRAQLERILAEPGLSGDVYEIASKALQPPNQLQ